MQPNSNDVLFHSSRQQHDDLSPKELALLGGRGGGLPAMASSSENTESETESSGSSSSVASPSEEASTSKSTILPPSVVSRSSKKSYLKGLQVLERRQKERGITDTSLAMILSQASTMATSAAPSGESTSSNPLHTFLSEVQSSGSVGDGGEDGTRVCLSSDAEEEERPTTMKEPATTLFDQLMANLSHPSQVLGISTSSSGTLEAGSKDGENDTKHHAVQLMKKNACATSKTLGGSFDMIAFHDIKSAPTPSQMSDSESWTEDATYANATTTDGFISAADIKKKFQNYVDYSDKPIGASLSWSDKSNSDGSNKRRNKKWNKKRTKVMRSVKRSKARLMKGVNVQLLLPVKATFGRFKKAGKACSSKTRNIETVLPLQQRMKRTLSVRMSSVSTKMSRVSTKMASVSTKISSVSTKMLSIKDYKKIANNELSALDPVPSSSDDSNKRLSTLKAHQDATFSLETPAMKRPLGLGSLTKKTIACNRYMQRKSQQYKVGTVKAIDSLRRSMRSNYKSVGHVPEDEHVMLRVILSHSREGFEVPRSDRQAGDQTTVDQTNIDQPNADAVAQEGLQNSAAALVFVDDGEIETTVQTGLISKEGTMDIATTAEDAAELTPQGKENSPEECIEVAKTKTLLSETAPEVKVGGADSLEMNDMAASSEDNTNESQPEHKTGSGQLACPLPTPMKPEGNVGAETAHLAVQEQMLKDSSHPERTPSSTADNSKQLKTVDLIKQPNPQPGDGDAERNSGKVSEDEIAMSSLKILERFNGSKTNEDYTEESGVGVEVEGNGRGEVDLGAESQLQESRNEQADKLEAPVEGAASEEATPLGSPTKTEAAGALREEKRKRHSWRSNTVCPEATKPPRGPSGAHAKDKLVKRSLPTMLSRARNAEASSRAAKPLPEFAEENIDAGDVTSANTSHLADPSRKPIPDVLPLLKNAVDAASGATRSVHSVVETSDNSVEMIVEAGKTDAEEVKSSSESKEYEEAIAVSNLKGAKSEEADDNQRSNQGAIPDSAEQELNRPKKGRRSSIKARTMKFLKPKRRLSSPQSEASGAGEESHSGPPLNDDAEGRRLDDAHQPPEPTEEENAESATAAKQTPHELGEHVAQDSGTFRTFEDDDDEKEEEEEEETEDNEEAAETNTSPGTGNSDGFLPDLAWLVPTFFCAVDDDDGIPEGWVDGCGVTSMDSNGSFTTTESAVSARKNGVRRQHSRKKRIPFFDDETLESKSDDVDNDEDFPVTSPALLNEMLAFNCRYGCEEGGLGIVESDVSSVTSNSTDGHEDSTNHDEIVVEKQAEGSPVSSSCPRATKDVEDANNLPSQWVEFPEPQMRTEKNNEEKKTIARRGVKKFLSLVKRRRGVGKGKDKLLTIQEGDVHGQGGGVFDAAGKAVNEASLISFLSESAVSTNSWTCNSDVFSGVASGTSPRRKVEQT